MDGDDQLHPVAGLYRREVDGSVVERVQTRMGRTRRRRVALRKGLIAGGLGVVGVGWVFVLTQTDPGPHPGPAPGPRALRLEGGEPLAPGWSFEHSDSKILRFADGSSVKVSAGAKLSLENNERDLVTFRLESGEAEFSVRPGGDRQWRVVAARLTATVLGTRFRVKTDVVTEVTVYQGRVLVEGPGLEASVVLSAGQSASAPGRVPDPESLGPEDGQARRPPRTQPKRTRQSVRARRSMSRERPAVVSSSSEQMLQSADEAKAEGRYEVAAQMLVDLLEQLPESEEAPYAAFSLGIIRMDHLGQPQEAADAFSTALQSPKLPRSLRHLANERSVALRQSRSRPTSPSE